MKKTHVAAIDGIPSIMPGTGSLLPPNPLEFDEDEPNFPPCGEGYGVSKGQTTTKHQRRMMPCNRD